MQKLIYRQEKNHPKFNSRSKSASLETLIECYALYSIEKSLILFKVIKLTIEFSDKLREKNK